ncbi:uncharacterized protein T551_01553 [Pneumocystis jirovecii RU7]|uniref:Cysteine-rich transmembrane CYSTM domain-containing protein n=1 Tax=Pneumocystis jirovecii (strain RU7) TaxID=1408657 RepID=A0A0W4ZRK9_PNEJ7|nr:uncharacterized protein T551_01553 [Pneumocystis jirovecii RU7]KTW31001.1 hypothetical protein T551_01553 [Pneumocystis jirovecii RU7]
MSSKEYDPFFFVKNHVTDVLQYENDKCPTNQCYTQPPPQYPQQSYCPQAYQGGYPCPPPPNTYGYCNNYYPQQQPVYAQQQPSTSHATTGCLACLAACCACCMLEECLR